MCRGTTDPDVSGGPEHETQDRRIIGLLGLTVCYEEREGVAMPNPKHKHSRERRDTRRTQKLRMTPPGMSVCPQCHEIKLPHYTCLKCGTYKGKAVIQVEES